MWRGAWGRTGRRREKAVKLRSALYDRVCQYCKCLGRGLPREPIGQDRLRAVQYTMVCSTQRRTTQPTGWQLTLTISKKSQYLSVIVFCSYGTHAMKVQHCRGHIRYSPKTGEEGRYANLYSLRVTAA